MTKASVSSDNNVPLKKTNKIQLKEYETDPKFDDRFFVNMSCEFEIVWPFLQIKRNAISGLRIVQSK